MASTGEVSSAVLTDERKDSAGGSGQAVVTFFTTTYAQSMPEQTYSVPLSVLPDGLNSLVQSVLGVDGQNFDFLYNDEYIGTSLLRFLHRRGISYEELLNIEYTPALQAKEGSLLPHDDWVSSVRAPYAGNAELLLTGAYDHCVRLWDGENCLALGTFHKECVKEVCLHPLPPSPEVTGTSEGSDAGAKKRKRTRANAATTDFVCASCSKDGSVAAWHYESASSELRLLGTVNAHTDGVDSLDISADGALLATASWDASVKVYQWEQLLGGDTVPSKKAPQITFTDHTRPVLSCRFSPTKDASVLYSAGLDGVVKCLNVAQGQLQQQMKGDHAINGLAVKPAAAGADLILTACTDNRARLYDTRQKDVVKTFGGHRQWLYATTWLWKAEEGDAPHSGGSLFATCSEDATVRVYDLRCTNTALLTLDTLHTDGVLDVTYVGQSLIASGGKDNKTKSFSLTKEALV